MVKSNLTTLKNKKIHINPNIFIHSGLVYFSRSRLLVHQDSKLYIESAT